MGNLNNDTHQLASPTTEGSGWAVALTGAGYFTQARHFYPKGERRSVCTMRLRKAKPVAPVGPEVRKCKGCTEWVEKHPNGGRQNKGSRL